MLSKAVTEFNKSITHAAVSHPSARPATQSLCLQLFSLGCARAIFLFVLECAISNSVLIKWLRLESSLHYGDRFLQAFHPQQSFQHSR